MRIGDAAKVNRDTPIQWPWLGFGLLVLIALVTAIGALRGEAFSRMTVLLLIALVMGSTLYHAAFGFTGAYRRLILERDMSGILAHFLMLALAMVLFAPTLQAGEVYGQSVSGAVAPVSVSMAIGAFMFGMGMQFGGGCASGTLFSVGSGNLKMLLVLLFFCLGGFAATFHFDWWTALPSAGSINLSEQFGRSQAVAMQLGLLALLSALLWAMRFRSLVAVWPVWRQWRWRQLICGPWPLVPAALLLAVLNWLSLLVAGHPWSVTWALTLWAAKLAVVLGWDPASTAFWVGGMQERALNSSLFDDNTSVMNMGIVLGALCAAALAGRYKIKFDLTWQQFYRSAVGGLMLGYGARLAYGCNIGALFSGIGSATLHGWVWLFAALLGNFVALKLLPRPAIMKLLERA